MKVNNSLLPLFFNYTLEGKLEKYLTHTKSHKSFMIDLVAESSSSLLSGSIPVGLEPFIPKKDSKYVNVWFDFAAGASTSAGAKTAQEKSK